MSPLSENCVKCEGKRKERERNEQEEFARIFPRWIRDHEPGSANLSRVHVTICLTFFVRRDVAYTNCLLKRYVNLNLGYLVTNMSHKETKNQNEATGNNNCTARSIDSHSIGSFLRCLCYTFREITPDRVTKVENDYYIFGWPEATVDDFHRPIRSRYQPLIVCWSVHNGIETSRASY